MSFESVNKFEIAIENFFGAPFAVAVDSCTHGIELSLRYLNEESINVPCRTYLSIPFLSKKLGIQLNWDRKPWKDFYYLTDKVIDAAVLWKRNSYVPGKFINASLDKASEHNERNILVLENNKNEEIIVVQIAGLIARRILSFVNLFDSLKIGERFGLIRFGSRVDVYLPSNYDAKVELGQKVTAGETIIAS